MIKLPGLLHVVDPFGERGSTHAQPPKHLREAAED